MAIVLEKTSIAYVLLQVKICQDNYRKTYIELCYFL